MLIITGTYPPERCGVGDYTYNLLQAQAAKDWHLLYFKDWSLKTFFKKIKEINHFPDEWVNIQYPSVGYGDSLIPHLLCIYFYVFRQKRVSVTIHEYTQYGWKGKAAMFIILFFASKLIFTNSFERNAAVKTLPSVVRKSKVIKIFSNIKSATIIPKIADRKYDVGYFGYIIPQKGIESFLQIAEELKMNNADLNIFVMGQIHSNHTKYADSIIQQAKDIKMGVFINKEENEAAEILSQTKIAFLPFPDGISERRGSFLAAVNNGCLIVTTDGKFVTQELRDCCEIVEIPRAKNKIIKLLSEKEQFDEKQNKIKDYLTNEVPHSWNDIANMYNNYLQ